MHNTSYQTSPESDGFHLISPSPLPHRTLLLCPLRLPLFPTAYSSPNNLETSTMWNSIEWTSVVSASMTTLILSTKTSNKSHITSTSAAPPHSPPATSIQIRPTCRRRDNRSTPQLLEKKCTRPKKYETPEQNLASRKAQQPLLLVHLRFNLTPTIRNPTPLMYGYFTFFLWMCLDMWKWF